MAKTSTVTVLNGDIKFRPGSMDYIFEATYGWLNAEEFAELLKRRIVNGAEGHSYYTVTLDFFTE